MRCCEPGGVRFFCSIPCVFVIEIKLMGYFEILLWNLEASRNVIPVNIWVTFQGAGEIGTPSSGYEPKLGLIVRDTFIRSVLALVT